MTTTKRPYGHGSRETLPSGRVRVRLRVDGKRRTLGVVPTREDGDALLDGAIDAERVSGRLTGALTLREWGTIWLRRREIAGMRSIKSARSVWKTHVATSDFAGWALTEIRKREVKAWLRAVRRGRERQTAVNALNILRGALGEAVDDELIAENPAAGLRLPRETRTDDPWTWMPLDEVALLEAELTDDELLIVRVAYGTGIRSGELRALRLVDVHAGRDELEPRIVVRYGGPPAKPTKSGKPRTVPLFGVALDAMRAWLARLPTYCAKNERRLAFPTARGGVRSSHVLGTLGKKLDGKRPDRFVLAAQRAGLLADESRPLCWHSLRHTCASLLISGAWGRAWSLTEIQALLGHESQTTTERYAHLAGTALTAAARAHDDGPRLAHAPHRSERKSPGFSAAPPARIERATFGLGILTERERLRGLGPSFGPRVDQLHRAAAAGDAVVADEAARSLALAVLAQPVVRLAMDVLAGGPHALDRALDLAAALGSDVLEDVGARHDAAGSGKRAGGAS